MTKASFDAILHGFSGILAITCVHDYNVVTVKVTEI